MRLLDGRPCTLCGCCDSRLLRKGENWLGQWEERQCNHCGRIFRARLDQEPAPGPEPSAPVAPPPAPTLLTAPVPCPSCKSTSTKVASSRVLVRYHKCKNCGHSFKTARNPAT